MPMWTMTLKRWVNLRDRPGLDRRTRRHLVIQRREAIGFWTCVIGVVASAWAGDVVDTPWMLVPALLFTIGAFVSVFVGARAHIRTNRRDIT